MAKKRPDSNIILLDNADAEFKESLLTVEEQILERVIDYLDKFATSGGYFDTSQKPFALINNIKKEISKIIKNSDYESAVDEYLLSFDGINKNIQAIQNDYNGIRVPRSLMTPVQKALIEQTKDGLLDYGVNAKFADPIKKALFTQVNLGGSVADTRAILKQIILPQDKNGVLSQYAGQVARDAGQQYEGHINQTIKKEYDLNATAYIGSLVKDSRKQCKRWVEMIKIPDARLQREIDWAFKNGSGMIAGTNPENFCVVRGGHNCRHTAYPTSI